MAAWNLADASYASKSFDCSAQETSPRGVFFKPDGTKMYVCGVMDAVYQYSLSTAWDVSTASYDSKSYNPSEETDLLGVFFKSDGTKMYLVGFADIVYQYSLSTAWDVSTASYDNKSFDGSSQSTNAQGIFIKADGTKLYIVHTYVAGTGRRVYQYTMSTAWDVSTASYDSKVDYISEDTYPQGVFFKDDGTKMYVVGSNNDSVFEYDLSTAWDVSTATYNSVSLDVSFQSAAPSDVFFKPDGSGLYVVDQGGSVYQYTITTGAAGYGNDVFGVASTNIAKINGVAIADISKVNQA